MAEFTGFGGDTFRFLRELEANNNRDWFNDNKARYEACVREPALDFIVAMAPVLTRISPELEAVPKKVGGSLMLVYRDTRFSRDKTPYKTNVGIQFRHRLGQDVHCPGFYLHIDSRDLFIGAGMWRPDPGALRAIRERIDARPKEWLAARDPRSFRKYYELSGESLKRPPKGFSADHPLLDDLKRKDFIATCSLSVDDVAGKSLVKHCGRLFGHASPLMAFLCRAIDVPF